MPTTLLPAKAVMADFGDVSEMTLHRWLRDESMAFPQPIYIKNRRYFDEAEIEDFKRRAVSGAVRSGRKGTARPAERRSSTSTVAEISQRPVT